MISEEEKIVFLPNPKLNPEKLDHLREDTKDVYANLFEIKLLKNLQLYQYPFSVFPDVGEGDYRIRNQLFRDCSKELRKIYGECCISGDSLYGMNKIEEKKIINCKLILKKVGNEKTEYFLEIQKCAKQKVIDKKNINKDPLGKQFIEILIRDILHSNPKLEFYRDLFVLTEEKKIIDNIIFYPGFTTSFIETEKGNFLNVTLKNKIIQKNTMLDYLIENKYKDPKNHERIAKNLIGRSFKVSYSKKNYKIYDILFGRNPTNQAFNYEGGTVKLIDYYQNIKKMKIKDEEQPIIVVRKKGPQDSFVNLYFIPELCFLAGLEDSEIKDKNLMKQLSFYTKLKPDDRIKKANIFLDLLNEKGKKDKNKSPLEKTIEYGIEVSPVKDHFKAYMMKEPILIGEKNKNVIGTKVFRIAKKANMLSWLCFYEKKNYNAAGILYNTLDQASIKFGLKINEPEWIEMPNNASPKDWTDTAEDYIGKGKDDYSFAIFFIEDNTFKNEKLYCALKKHSLCTNGYISQVVKVSSIMKKGAMSVCSKILLQINAKLRGFSYQIQEQYDDNKKLMVIGIDSSYIKKKGRGIAMVATVNDSYTDFYNREEIIKEKEEKEKEEDEGGDEKNIEIKIKKIEFPVKSFIEDAIKVYKKLNNDIEPQGIIIYRQGVSLQQKDFLKIEIEQIEEFCNKKDINFYYILVNTKTTFKFFEIEENVIKQKNRTKTIIEYYNPEPGLLIFNGVTNKKYFEFYIQPQVVTVGSATPTCFHVAYGDLDFAENIPKFTYDLCYMYSNWQGAVRVPNVLKAAEKLSKMTAKYTYEQLHSDLELGQAYL